MNNNNALSLYQGGGFETMQRAAQAMVQSGYFKDSRDIAQAVVKVMAGAELGISPFAAMSGVHIVQGKPTLSSNLIATLVKNDPRYDYRVKVATDTECILIWFENGDAVGESLFTMQEANNAGLTGKSTWKQYASDMLFARALTRGARRYAPGIFGGAPVYTPEEVGADLDYDGNIVTIEHPAARPQPQKPPAMEPAAEEPETIEFEDLQPAPRKNGSGNGSIPTNLRDFAIWFAEHDTTGHYKNNIHVVKALQKEFGDNIGVQFSSRDPQEYADALTARVAE